MSETMNRLLRFMRGNEEAANFLNGIVGVLHLWDDLIDKDQDLPDERINQVFWYMLIALPRDTFYKRNFDLLNPILMVSIQNWMAANKLEREGSVEDGRIAFILRSSYVDLITQSALIVGGLQWSEQITPEIRRFAHSEGYANYLVNLQVEKDKRGRYEKQSR